MNQGVFPDIPVSVLNHRIEAKKDNAKDAATRFPFLLGVELELENVRGGNAGVDMVGWTQHIDESLRNGIEYVTDAPMGGDKISAAIKSFYAKGLRYVGSPRTSTHIHVNAGDLTVRNVRTMFVVSYMLEDAMFRVLEAKRKFCGYCMPLTEMSPQRVRNFLASDSIDSFGRALAGPNAEKYYGFNAVSLKKHGTLEFRYFPGAPSQDELLSWMDYCTAVKRIGLTYSLDDLSGIQDADELSRWLELNLGKWGTKMLNAVGGESIFAALSEVLAFVPDVADAVARRDELVFISPILIKYMGTSYCSSPEQRDWLVPKLEALQVMTANEWYETVNDSIYHAKQSKQAARLHVQADEVVRYRMQDAEPVVAWANEPMPEPQQEEYNLAAVARQLDAEQAEVQMRAFREHQAQMQDLQMRVAADAARRLGNRVAPPRNPGIIPPARPGRAPRF
jgi:hypothetical protein